MRRATLVTGIIALCVFVAPNIHSTPIDSPLHHYVQRTWRVSDGLPSDNVRAIVQTWDGYMWFGTDAGLVRFDGMRFELFNSENEVALKSHDIRAMCEGIGDSLWLATSSGFVLRKNGSFTRFTTEDGLLSNDLTAVQRDKEGSIWIGTAAKGLNRYKDGRFESFTTSNGLPSNQVTTILTRNTKDGEELWIGTAHGLTLYKDWEFSTFPGPDHVRDLLNDKYSILWIGEEGGNVSYLRNGKLEDMPFQNTRPEQINTIFTDNEDKLWIGTGSGLYLGKKRELVAYSKQHRFFELPINVITEDSEHNLWIGTQNSGVHFFRKEKFASYNERDGLPKTPIEYVAANEMGGIFAASKSKLFELKDGLFSEVKGTRKSDGSQILPLPSNQARSTHEDHEGLTWMVTSEGLSLLRKDKQIAFGVDSGLPEGPFHSLVEDSMGRFWSITSTGVVRIDRSQLLEFAEEKRSSVAHVLYDHHDGLKTPDISKTRSGTSALGADGRIWFAIDGYLSVVDPKVLYASKTPPKLHFEKVLIDGKEVPPKETMEIDSGVKVIDVHFMALSLGAPEDVHFKYILYGKKEANWVDLGKMHHGSIRLENLAPGDNWITLTANNSENPRYEQVLTMTFKRQVEPSKEKVKPRVIFLLISAILVGLFLFRNRILNSPKKN